MSELDNNNNLNEEVVNPTDTEQTTVDDDTQVTEPTNTTSNDEPTDTDTEPEPEPETHNEDIDPSDIIDVGDPDDGDEEVIEEIHKIDITDKINYQYMLIPGDYMPVYKQLLYALSKIGKNIMDDCAYSCKQSGHNIFVCWHLFQSAIAAYNIGEYKKADLFINYIKAQLPKSIRLEQIELDVIQNKYPNVKYYINKNGSYVFTIQVIYKGRIYQRTLTLPMAGYIPPVKVKNVVYENFTLEAITSYLQEKGYTSPFEITKEDLDAIPTSIILENGSHPALDFNYGYVFVPTGVGFTVLDLLGNQFEFVEGETKHTTSDGVYYLLVQMTNVTINII